MDEVPINVQQLPITILENVVAYLNRDEKIVLVNTNKYLNSIVSPILYKNILFDYDLDVYANVIDVVKELDEKLSRLDRNDPLYSAKVADCGRSWCEVAKETDKFRQKAWSELKYVIKKNHNFILESQCFDPNNLVVELESYSNLKRYKLNINSQQCMEQLINYRGNKFKLMEKLELYVGSDLKFDVEDLFHHFMYLKELKTNMELFHDDLKRISGFSSNTLTNLFVESIDEVSFEFLHILSCNFKNLKRLGFEFNNMSWDSNLTELPIFENLLYLTFEVYDDFDPKALNYMSNAKAWPKLMELEGYYPSFNGVVLFEGKWNSLIKLKASNINFTNLNQWCNFNQLQVLELTIHPRTDSKMLQAIFVNLTKLTTLTLSGKISSHHFDFLPLIRLNKLYISKLIDFSQPFVNFLKALVTIKELWLYFTDNAFEDVNLNILLEEKHEFPNLKYVKLYDLPQQLGQWLTDCNDL